MTTSVKRMTVFLAALLYFISFPHLASLLADVVPFAHLIFAPFGSTYIATVAFALVFGWLLLVWGWPSVIDRTARSMARAIGVAIILIWVAYSTFWLILYVRGGL